MLLQELLTLKKILFISSWKNILHLEKISCILKKYLAVHSEGDNILSRKEAQIFSLRTSSPRHRTLNVLRGYYSVWNNDDIDQNKCKHCNRLKWRYCSQQWKKMNWRQKVWSQYTVIAWIPILQDQIQLPLFTPLGKIRVSGFLVSVTRIFFMWYKWGKNEFLVSRMCLLTSFLNKVATATSTVQVLPKILYFSTLISSWIWYSENNWLAHNFPHIRPSRSLSWLLSLWPTKLRLSLSNKKNNITKKLII